MMKNLSKEELKNITGGIAAGPTCNSGSVCSVVSISPDGTTTQSYGTCSMTSSGTYISCYCSAWGGDPITSNGGRSYCWS